MVCSALVPVLLPGNDVSVEALAVNFGLKLRTPATRSAYDIPSIATAQRYRNNIAL